MEEEEASSWTNVYQRKRKFVADSKRNEEFHQIFKDAPQQEIVAEGIFPLFSSSC